MTRSGSRVRRARAAHGPRRVTRRQILAGAGAALLATQARGGAPPAATPRPRPNLFISYTDDWAGPVLAHRRDPRLLAACDLQNFPTPLTPTLTTLALAGVDFWRTLAGDATCAPSRKTWWSGYSQREGASGLRFATLQNPGSGVRPLPVQLAIEAGYKTLWLGKTDMGMGPDALGTENPLLDHDSIDQCTHGDLSSFESFLRARAADGVPWCVCWCPYAPHASYYHPDRAEYVYDGNAILAGLHACGHAADLTAGAAADYYGSCSWVDGGIDGRGPQMLARALSLIEQYGFTGSTVVINSSDNGALLSDAKQNLSLDGMQVGMIIRAPMMLPPTGLHPAMICQQDLVPTVRELAGLPPIALGDFGDARSFASLLNGSGAPSRTVQFMNRNWPGNTRARDASGFELEEDRYGNTVRMFRLALADGTPVDPFEQQPLDLAHLSSDARAAKDALHSALAAYRAGAPA